MIQALLGDRELALGDVAGQAGDDRGRAPRDDPAGADQLDRAQRAGRPDLEHELAAAVGHHAVALEHERRVRTHRAQLGQVHAIEVLERRAQRVMRPAGDRRAQRPAVDDRGDEQGLRDERRRAGAADRDRELLGPGGAGREHELGAAELDRAHRRGA